jgi:hypothetical protein
MPRCDRDKDDGKSFFKKPNSPASCMNPTNLAFNKSCQNIKSVDLVEDAKNVAGNIKDKIRYFDDSTNPCTTKAENSVIRSPTNSNDRKVKNKILASFAKSNFRNNPNFVKRSITSISAKGDAVRGKYAGNTSGTANRVVTRKLIAENLNQQVPQISSPYDEALDRDTNRDNTPNEVSNTITTKTITITKVENPTNATEDKYSGITKRYSSSNQYRNFIKDRFSPKNKDTNKTTIQIGSPQLTTAQINDKIKREIENSHSRTAQQLNLLMNKTMKWVVTQEFKKWRPADVQEYKNDPATLQIGH